MREFEAAGNHCDIAADLCEKYGVSWQQLCDAKMTCYMNGREDPWEEGEGCTVAEADVVELCKRLGLPTLAEKQAAEARAKAKRAAEKAELLERIANWKAEGLKVLQLYEDISELNYTDDYFVDCRNSEMVGMCKACHEANPFSAGSYCMETESTKPEHAEKIAMSMIINRVCLLLEEHEPSSFSDYSYYYPEDEALAAKCPEDYYADNDDEKEARQAFESLVKKTLLIERNCEQQEEEEESVVEPSFKKAKVEAKPAEDWSKLTVAKLKEELTKRGLDTKGKKAELVARLEAAGNDDAMGVDDSIVIKRTVSYCIDPYNGGRDQNGGRVDVTYRVIVS